jgi:hypothetical protein
LWGSGGVTECGAEPADGVVQAIIEVHERLGPKALAEFLTGHELAWSSDEHLEQLERLLLNRDATPEPPQVARDRIELELAKAHDRSTSLSLHG